MGNYLRLDKVNANDYIESVVSTTPLVNGQFVKLKKLDMEKGQEVVVVEKAEAGKAPHAVMTTEFIDYGTDLHYDITKQELPVGKVGRAFHLVNGQRYAFLKDQVADSSTLKEGDRVAVGVHPERKQYQTSIMCTQPKHRILHQRGGEASDHGPPTWEAGRLPL